MDYQNREKLRQQLAKCGFPSLDDDLLDEFIESLKDRGDGFSSSISERSSPKKSGSIQKSSNITNPSNNKKVSLPEANTDDDEEIEEEEEVEAPPPKPRPIKTTSKTSSPKRRSPQKMTLAEKYDEDEEINNWSKRIRTIQSKAQDLDSQIIECRKAIVDDDVGDEKDVPLYFGTSERKLDPYPTVKKKMSGGFIRPPPVRTSRKTTGPKGRRLLYEERNPEYIPPPERRRDELRWQIRQKLIYSDPKYH